MMLIFPVCWAAGLVLHFVDGGRVNIISLYMYVYMTLLRSGTLRR